MRGSHLTTPDKASVQAGYQTQYSPIAKVALQHNVLANMAPTAMLPPPLTTNFDTRLSGGMSSSNVVVMSPTGLSPLARVLSGDLPCELPPSYHQAMNEASLVSTPSTAPTTPRILPMRQNSGSSTPRVRPPATTLNIPGMTRSRVSPDGKIAKRDVASKLVIIMVGLPARGKSYITKKIARYLSWQQHDTKIFNVGHRRRVAAGTAAGPFDTPPRSPPTSPRRQAQEGVRSESLNRVVDDPTQGREAVHILLNITNNGRDPEGHLVTEGDAGCQELPNLGNMEQNAEFFDPSNVQAAQMREQVAMATLDELLDYLIYDGGSVGILDATNSTVERRALLYDHVKEREPKLSILFIESICENTEILEANMRLKLRGPDYKDKNPEASLADFRKRIVAYESAYVPLGQYEEDRGIQYIKMIDVGRKSIQHQLKGFLPCDINNYLSTFNLSPRQIWITRHGQSSDNVLGKLGGDSSLTVEGRKYGKVLHDFITNKRREWLQFQQKQIIEDLPIAQTPGFRTPPYPDILGELENKNFCVWTSMLQRSVQTAEAFELDDDYDVKAWAQFNELHSGSYEGLTYKDIATKFPAEYGKRHENKLQYTYPGVGGEGYLHVINRVREMVREIERITDSVLIIGHRSVARVLMAYFMDLTRDDIANLDVPLGVLYMIEPKPYGLDFRAYKYNADKEWFDELEGYKPQRETAEDN